MVEEVGFSRRRKFHFGYIQDRPRTALQQFYAHSRRHLEKQLYSASGLRRSLPPGARGHSQCQLVRYVMLHHGARRSYRRLANVVC